MRTLPSGAGTTWGYNPHGFVAAIASRQNGSLFDLHNYRRDLARDITQGAWDGRTWSYSYDDLYRISTSTVNAVNYAWQYNLAGNRTQQIAGGVTTNYTVNSADQLTAVNGTAVSTDANGNVTQDEAGGTYSWDVRGRLKSLTRSGVTSMFGYSQDDLRTSQTVNGTQTTYLLDGESVVQERTSGVATDLLQGPGIDNLLMRGSQWIVPGELGNTAMTLDGSGNVWQWYFYQPFGQLAEMGGGGTAIPYQFTGREADAGGLMYYRARYYNPSWGRFVSRDPLGVGGLANLAAFASVRDQVRPDDGMQPGAPGPVAGRGSAAGSPWEQGETTRVLGLGVRVTAPAWLTNTYAYAGNNPVDEGDPSGGDAGWADWGMSLYVGPPYGTGTVAQFLSPYFCGGLLWALNSLYNTGLLGALNPLDPRTAQEIISAERKGSINREFPKQYLDETPADILQDAQAGNRFAKKAWKLLNDNRWVK